MKTIKDLNQKMWYRLVNVMYYIILVVSIIFSIYISFSQMDSLEIDFNSSIVKCGDGKVFTYSQIDKFNFGGNYFPEQSKKLLYVCNYDKFINFESNLINKTPSEKEKIIESELDRIGKLPISSKIIVEEKYTYFKVTLSWLIPLVLYIVSIFIFLGIFEAIIHYIILGNINPKE